VLSTGWFEPATNSSEDLAATNRSRDFELGWFAEPIFKGDYPETMRTRIANRSYKDGYIKSRLPEFTEKEKAKLRGINFYESIK
jgi:beta-glucosidase